jgi:16S rRNA (cytosine967-C5)-methyltransferase
MPAETGDARRRPHTQVSTPGTRSYLGSVPAASPARRAAFRVVRRVLEQDAFADQALHAEAAALDPRDRAFARQLAYGTVQRRRTLDHLIGRLTARRRLDPPIRAALQLGVFQLLFLEAVPAHAAVDESVELAKGSRGAGLVNAVLRRAADEGAELLAGIEDEGVRESYPHWLVDLWRKAYGKTTATKLMRRLNEPPETALRANRLKTSPERLAEALGGRAAGGPDAVVLDGPFDAYGHPLWREGHFMPQSRSSQAVARAVAPQPGERILDLCAAPGGKTTHLAALMHNEGEILSVERQGDRADALRRTCERMGVTIARVEVGDAAEPRDDGPFDRVLADPPCSGLGTLQQRPDLRWRMSPERIAGIVAEQAAILRAAAASVRPGGVLVWSTCTLNPAENADLLAGLDGFAAQEATTLFPHETRSAGFEITRLGSVA